MYSRSQLSASGAVFSSLLLIAGAICAQDKSNVRFLDGVAIVEDVSLVHTAQILPLDEAGRLVGNGNAAQQIARVFRNLHKLLDSAKSTRIVKLNVYAANQEAADDFARSLPMQDFATANKPVVSYVVGKLPHPEALVALDAVATAEEKHANDVEKREPKFAATPGSQGIAIMPAGSRVYVSGQAEKGTLAEATRATLESLKRTLNHESQTSKGKQGLATLDIVQLKAFMRPMSEVAVVRAEIAKFFDEQPRPGGGKGQPIPPLILVEWESTLPIEIELVAWGGKAREGEPIEYLTPPWMKSSPVFSRVARINHGPTIYIGGLWGDAANNGQAEVEGIFTQLDRHLRAAGSDFKHLAKATYYVSTEDASKKLNELRPRYYDARRAPAASKALVAGVGRDRKTITLDIIAVPVE